MKELSKYEQHANETLLKMGIEFNAEFIKHDFHFKGDKEKRDIYKITLKRGKRSFSFDFGQSIANSGEWIVKDKLPKFTKVFNDRGLASSWAAKIGISQFAVTKNPNKKAPNEYDVLACLQKYDPGTFENFCSEFGYDTDSRSAKKTYKAVREEYFKTAAFFNSDEIEIIQEIN